MKREGNIVIKEKVKEAKEKRLWLKLIGNVMGYRVKRER